MGVLNPVIFTLGALSVVIPIAIHMLMRQRKRPVAWGAMRFLVEAYRRSHRRLAIERWLLLATRCLVVLMLAAALGRISFDALSGAPARGPVFLVIDDSLTSATEDADGRSALERSRQAAADALTELTRGVGDRRVGLISLSAPASIIVKPTPDTGAVAAALQRLTPTGARADFDALEALVANAARESAPASESVGVLLFSELRRGSFTPQAGRSADSGATSLGLRVAALTPAQTPVSNAAVVGVNPLRPTLLVDRSDAAAPGGDQVRIALQRFGPTVRTPAESTVRVVASVPGGSPDALPITSTATHAWTVGQQDATTSSETPELQGIGAGAPRRAAIVEASIERDAIRMDNTRARAVALRDEIGVAIIDSAADALTGTPGGANRDTTDWLRLALKPTGLTPVRFEPIDPAAVQATPLGAFDALFVARPDLLAADAWTRIADTVADGALLVVIAPADPADTTWSNAMRDALGLAWVTDATPQDFDPPARLTAPPPDPDPRSALGLLDLIDAEAADLLAPVHVWRASPPRFDADAEQTGRALITLADGSAFVWAGHAPKAPLGLLVYIASPFDFAFTDLPTRPVVVPLVQEIVRQGVGRVGIVSAIAGRPIDADALPPAATEFVPLDESGAPDTSRARAKAPGDGGVAIHQPGLWVARDASGADVALIAVNPDTTASDTAVQTPEAIEPALRAALGLPAADANADPAFSWIDAGDATGADVARALARPDSDDDLSGLILVILLALCAAEAGLARVASHAQGATRTGAA